MRTEFLKNQDFRKKFGNPLYPHPSDPESNFFFVSRNVTPQYPARILKLSLIVFHPGQKMSIGLQYFSPFLGVSCPFSLEVPAAHYLIYFLR